MRVEELKGAHPKAEIGVLGERHVRFLVSTTSLFSVSYSGLSIMLSLETLGKARTYNARITAFVKTIDPKAKCKHIGVGS